MEANNKIIGITGKIGAGKTFICRMLSELGYPVFQADIEVRKLYKEQNIIKQLAKIVPQIDFKSTRELRDILFNNSDLLKKFEAVLHPLVNQRLEDFLKCQKGKKTIFIEAPLFFESNYNEFCNYVLIVVANDNIRKNRVIIRDDINEELFNKIDAKQLSYEEMLKKSDFIIENNDNDEDTKRQLENILIKIEK